MLNSEKIALRLQCRNSPRNPVNFHAEPESTLWSGVGGVQGIRVELSDQSEKVIGALFFWRGHGESA